jgi:hypothetical protein
MHKTGRAFSEHIFRFLALTHADSYSRQMHIELELRVMAVDHYTIPNARHLETSDLLVCSKLMGIVLGEPCRWHAL